MARRVDIRTLPFMRFEGNEAHNQLYGFKLVNGTEARPLTANFAEWEVTLPPARGDRRTVTAFAVDAEGNQEKLRHVVALSVAR